MKFAKRMDCFGEGVFSTLADIRRKKEEAGERVIDLSIGAPNIPPAEHIRRALCEAAADEKNYVYAISDRPELLEAAAGWYARGYGVTLDPEKMAKYGEKFIKEIEEPGWERHTEDHFYGAMFMRPFFKDCDVL